MGYRYRYLGLTIQSFSATIITSKFIIILLLLILNPALTSNDTHTLSDADVHIDSDTNATTVHSFHTINTNNEGPDDAMGSSARLPVITTDTDTFTCNHDTIMAASSPTASTSSSDNVTGLLASSLAAQGNHVQQQQQAHAHVHVHEGVSADFISWWGPRVMVYENFLSAMECDFIISSAKNHSTYILPTQAKHTSIYFNEYPRLPPLLQDIERRISVVTGTPPHPGEEALNVHHILKTQKAINRAFDGSARKCLSETTMTANRCALAVDGIHHDKVQKEFSSVTVIVYLNDVDIGGGTIFPCTTTYNHGAIQHHLANLKIQTTVSVAGSEYDHTDHDKASQREMLQHMHTGSKQLSEYCREGFNQNGRWYDGATAVLSTRNRKEVPDTATGDNLREIMLGAHFGCLMDEKLVDDSESATGTLASSLISRRAIRTRARAGTAAVFFHDQLDMLPDTQAWHSGCLPVSGDKWTMQKFKELPEGYRSKINSYRQKQ